MSVPVQEALVVPEVRWMGDVVGTAPTVDVRFTVPALVRVWAAPAVLKKIPREPSPPAVDDRFRVVPAPTARLIPGPVIVKVVSARLTVEEPAKLTFPVETKV